MAADANVETFTAEDAFRTGKALGFSRPNVVLGEWEILKDREIPLVLEDKREAGLIGSFLWGFWDQEYEFGEKDAIAFLDALYERGADPTMTAASPQNPKEIYTPKQIVENTAEYAMVSPEYSPYPEAVVQWIARHTSPPKAAVKTEAQFSDAQILVVLRATRGNARAAAELLMP